MEKGTVYFFIFYSENKRYNRSKSGWNEAEKREEMFEEKAYYMVAYDQSKPVGFCHFRFDMDYGSEVVYWYIIVSIIAILLYLIS